MTYDLGASVYNQAVCLLWICTVPLTSILSRAALVEEKNTRAKIRTETDRNLTKSRTVILDSLNFVKGYRYELWCLARAAGTKCCVFWVDTPVEVCREWNTARPADQVRPTSTWIVNTRCLNV